MSAWVILVSALVGALSGWLGWWLYVSNPDSKEILAVGAGGAIGVAVSFFAKPS